ncbi:MAG: PrsW family intramembrane metalloprotease [Myxococcales bacterium]|nr:PrsW family intramembrane metalloprotease [Myxococcales bacterium]
MLAVARWLLPALVPAVLCAVLARATARREPPWLVAVTFVLGAAFGLGALVLIHGATNWTGLDLRASAKGDSGALVFLFFVMAPTHEAAKVAAAWPAFLSKHVDQGYDGVVYAAAAALGFAAVQGGRTLLGHPAGGIWLARVALALPAHVFFASLWGYALGRARHARLAFPLFPAAFVVSIVAHGVYAYLVYGRGPGALLAVSPLLAAMGVVSWILGRDLRERDHARATLLPVRRRWRRLSSAAQPPSLSAVRAALRRTDQPVRVRWVLLGAMVSLGAMFSGLVAGVVGAHLLHIDLSTVDEHDLRAAAPALLLGAGLLASFPTSGWLIARASALPTLLEPALATALALAITLVALGLMSPFAVVFGLALSPIAWLLGCAGAWAGRPAPY